MKLRSVTAVLVLALALPAAAGAQSNSGLDQYGESPPGSSGSSDSGSTDGSGGAVGAGAADAVAPAGSSPGSSEARSDVSSRGLTEAEAVAAGGKTKGELPATGFDESLALGLFGAALVLMGCTLRWRLESEMPTPRI